MLVNIAYYAVVPLDVLSTSGTIVAANFFDIAFGGQSKRAISVFVALSALGNVMSVIFSQGRIIQQLGRENILPFSRFFASQRPFDTPMVGLLEHLIVCIVTVLAPPPGDAYNFIMNLISYPLNIVNLFVGIGLLYLNVQAMRGKLAWHPPIKATIPVSIYFTLASAYLVVAPYLAPDADQSVYKSLPYYLHCVVAIGIFAFGALYWLVWAVILPKLGGYYLYSHPKLDEVDGFWRTEIIQVKNGEAPPDAVNDFHIQTEDELISGKKSNSSGSDVV
ncbi:unnamed protein product [Ambrosiozyma monospora]|uniref:Unnamed protein product n=1 Tax=Ambrosiozyma monospora TaxID=43982 RepID=A0A9W6WHL1_AMBMO|nr:unnamed protein product [Ambrosiozyma monospora]